MDRAQGAVAIVGLSGRFPGAPDIPRFWRNLCDGVEAISFFDQKELIREGVDPELVCHPRYVRARGVLEHPDRFDATFFDLAPRAAAILSPQHRLLLECGWEALEDAGYDGRSQRGSIGVFAGETVPTYLLFNLQPSAEVAYDAATILGNDKDYLTTRLSYHLGLQGRSLFFCHKILPHHLSSITCWVLAKVSPATRTM